MFDWIVGDIGELRTDITTGTVYRYNGTEWVVNGNGTPSSDSFPIAWITVGEVREDLTTGGKFRWSGAAWVAIVDSTATLEDGGITTAKLADDAVETAKIKDLNVTTSKLADDAVETDKIKDLNVTTDKLADWAVTLAKTWITISDVTVLATDTTGDVTVPAGSVVLSIYPVSNQDHLIDSVIVSDTTLTVTLGNAATADNVFKVVTIV